MLSLKVCLSLASIVSVLVFFGGGPGGCFSLLGPFSASFSLCLLSSSGGRPGLPSCASFPPTKVHGLRHLLPGAIHVHSLFSFSPLPLAWVGSGSFFCSFCFLFSLSLSPFSLSLSLSLASDSSWDSSISGNFGTPEIPLLFKLLSGFSCSLPRSPSGFRFQGCRFWLSLCAEDTVRPGVWLGRHICSTAMQVSYGELNEDRNLMSTDRG